MSAASAGALQGLLSSVGILGALVMPTVIARGRGLRALAVSFGVALALGYVGLLLAPATVPWVWALLLGHAGLAFPTAIALITARTRHPSVTAQLSGFVQPVGYALAAIGPFAVGLIHDATGGWNLVLALLALTALPLTVAGVRVARPTYVDDEI
jgi:CP family cyanate transporter-like MFS transporter